MLFMLIVKASKNSEAGNRPSSELNEAMSKYNEELVKAGVRVAAKGLHPSSNGIRISYPIPGEKPVVTDGPFTETKELIAGFILIDVKSREEAIEWAMRMPDPQGHGEGQIELRQVFEAPELTEMLAKEAELREKSK
ncbi:YciI family protein [Fictibacillus sp. WQ 8-8]|uniref:YciI family protein n=1 Tax=unclassified Fictibacillus TaxID=2644029 RepID=UPI00210EC8E5|nr:MULTISPECIES: YciI family protein [unclassified Fictibacillus]MCQ6268845.1 YciI family protein [Fictibacillus sp. WQ 8-8]MED2972463.1 YciI family protein [Fictibacillus sp. B-59209]